MSMMDYIAATGEEAPSGLITFNMGADFFPFLVKQFNNVPEL